MKNEFTCINGDLIHKCNDALFWRMMADEVTDISTKEQLSVCVQYVHVKDDKLEVCEDFLGFCTVSSTDAETIATAVVAFCRIVGWTCKDWLVKGSMGQLT